MSREPVYSEGGTLLGHLDCGRFTPLVDVVNEQLAKADGTTKCKHCKRPVIIRWDGKQKRRYEPGGEELHYVRTGCRAPVEGDDE